MARIAQRLVRHGRLALAIGVAFAHNAASVPRASGSAPRERPDALPPHGHERSAHAASRRARAQITPRS